VSKKKSRTVSAKSDVSGPCPFCHHSGGTITADFSAPEGEAAPKEATGTLFHSLPTCETYDRMTGDEFIRAVIARKHVS
jgi:hypothetical protein